MPWDARGTMSLRAEFIHWAQQDGSFAALCRRFRISRKTGYKWLRRFQTKEADALKDRSRRPHNSPARADAGLEQRIVMIRQKHPAWGARKLRVILERQGVEPLPATSTITDILHRYGLIAAEESQKHTPYERFERAAPNELWQMDFKGHFPTDQTRCHPFTMIDDHSRYALALQACKDERTETVQERLISAFRRYGLPQAILADNGSPWGSSGHQTPTDLAVWLMRLNIRTLHGRPHHPQTQGKEERFHRTLKAELLRERFYDLEHCQQRFDQWRNVYNWERPHEALAMKAPGHVYKPSVRSYPERLPEIEYAPDMQIRKVDDGGRVRWQGRDIRVGRAFVGLALGVRPSLPDGTYEIYLGSILLKKLGCED